MLNNKYIVESQTQPQNIIQNKKKSLQTTRNCENNEQNQIISAEEHIESEISKEFRVESPPIDKINEANQKSNVLHQKDLLQQFKSSIIEKLEHLYYLFIPHNLLETIGKSQEIDQDFQMEPIQEVTQRLFSSEDQMAISKLNLIIQQNSGISRFLQWIYDAVPLLFCKELIRITCKLIIALQVLKNQDANPSFYNLSQNIVFMNHIFNDPSLKFLKIESHMAGFNSFVLIAPLQVMSFNAYYTRKILELSSFDLEKLQISTVQKRMKNTNQESQKSAKCQKSKKIVKTKKGRQTRLNK